MSDPNHPRIYAQRPTGIGAVSDGSAAASPRQVARLRFLGVPCREGLTISQAGALIDRTNADPAYAPKIEEWHVRKFELHPVLYPPDAKGVVIPDRQMEEGKFQLPPRGATEPTATIFQKRRLELFSGCDFPVIDSLGHQQAAALIAFLEAESVARSLAAIRAEAEARAQEAPPAAAPEPGKHLTRGEQPVRPARAGLHKGWLFAVAGMVAVGAFLHLGDLKRWTGAGSGTPAGAAVPSPEVIAFQREVALSQGRAVKKYPALGVAGSPLNKTFVAHYQQLSQQQSPRLNSPDWPEKLADECAPPVSARPR